VRRRKFIGLLGGTAPVFCPLAAHAQQPEWLRRIGILARGAESDPQMRVFHYSHQGLPCEPDQPEPPSDLLSFTKKSML
jgi:hypothetical protein